MRDDIIKQLTDEEIETFMKDFRSQPWYDDIEEKN